MSKFFILYVVAFALVAWNTSANKGMRHINSDGEDVTTVDKVMYDDTPEYVQRIEDEGQVYKLRKKFDVLAVLVVQEYDCERCSDAHRAFIEAADRVLEEDNGVLSNAGASVAFATIDAEREADEFSAMMEDNPDFHWFVPSVLIFKKSMQKLNRPPLMFNVNENLGKDLPHFLLRFAGPDFAPVSTERTLVNRITSEATEGVSFGWWGSADPHPALKRLVETERLNSLYHALPALDGDVNEETSRLTKKFNPTRAAFVAYRYKEENGSPEDSLSNVMEHISMAPLTLNLNDDFHIIYRRLEAFIAEQKTHRPGHEYDLVDRWLIKDIEVPPKEECGHPQHRTRHGDEIVIDITGKDLESGNQFLVNNDRRVTVGDAPLDGSDIPHSVYRRGLEGMCPGMVRHIVIPAGSAYHKTDCPPSLDPESRVLVEVRMLGRADEMPVPQGPDEKVVEPPREERAPDDEM